MPTRKCVIRLGLILSFFVFEVSAQFRTTNFELVGPVESIQSVTRPAFNSNKTETSGFLDSENFDSVFLKFDKRRNLILRENFLDYRGKLGIFDQTVYQINPSNQIEKLETTRIQNGEESRKISQKKKWFYLGNQLVRTDEFNSGRTSDQNWTTNSVYKNGLTTEKIYWMDDEIFSRDIYEFDKNHNPISEKNYFNNGSPGKTIIYENTPSGLPKKITTRTGNDLEIKSLTYKNAYPLRIDLIDKNGKIIQTELYDSNGRVTEIHKFNYKNNSSDIFGFIFETDIHNNWIQCQISKNNQPAYIITRTINYYKN